MATGRLLVGNVQFKITTLLSDDGNVHDNAYFRRKESLNLSGKMYRFGLLKCYIQDFILSLLK